ncbi:MAG TPA: DUF2231 domain-containing protein [Vicinamibacterales bacterium]|jgi:nitrite reductase/ring-hydroxylating ferredoxin subunit/uncharacterized membrane protein|nr:DUF2231 domain-containing protein [Vicinamibacterales bacterium]
MRSQASIKGHPIHPMLVPFPFAFLTGAWGFALAGAISKRRELTSVSRHLVPAGVAAGVLAAVPGLIDYVGTVPPASSGKSRATKHALLNSAALGLCSLGWLAGRNSKRTVLPLVLQGIGAAAISLGGWLGGTLAFRNQIGVDHRYANAGKWKDETVEDTGPAALSAAAHGLDFNQMKLVHADDTRIVIGRTGKGYAAFADRCTHRGGPLSDGVLMCGTVQCPWHGSQFDVQTGEVKCGPAKENIATYPIEGKPARTA